MVIRVVGMTENYPAGMPAGMPADPRPGLVAAIALGRTVIQQVGVDQLDLPTPCDEFTVAQLAAHSLGVLQRIVLVGQRSTEWPDLVPNFYQHANYEADWKRLADGVEQAWADDRLLGSMLTLPFAEMPGAPAVGLYTGEVLVHAWDLATAVGADVAWNQELAAATLVGSQMGLPAEIRDDPEVPFGAVVPTADDAPAMDRLVAWLGRSPSQENS
ncbi:MAG: hypothetical protein ACI8TP_002215 [Acidimicrobiales bacterium]|jgi:uncharacterized protein (TIGR03086 family)